MLCLTLVISTFDSKSVLLLVMQILYLKMAVECCTWYEPAVRRGQNICLAHEMSFGWAVKEYRDEGILTNWKLWRDSHFSGILLFFFSPPPRPVPLPLPTEFVIASSLLPLVLFQSCFSSS